MKKLLFVFVAVLATSFISCGNKTTPTDDVVTDSVDSLVVDSVDSLFTDSVVK